jgi:anaerobic selenocysteine-containing dehydrogenase
MKIDRRSFLAFVVGGAAGTALSPLPWKLTDDLSIWSQRWPWTPIPPKGEATFTATTCTLCPGGCGISVRKIEERVVKVEGLKGHPVNDGGICPLGLCAPQLLYSPTRVAAPLKKVDGVFRRISWESAIAEIAAKLKELRAAGRPESVAWIADSDRGTTAELCKRLLTVYGSPNFIRTPSIQDTYESVLFLTQGVRATAGFDLEHADFVLSFGSGLIEGWGSPVFTFRGKNAVQKNGGRVFQVEPRLSKTAAKADRWLAVAPGTEGALALGLIHVMLKEKLYRREFVEAQAVGLEALGRAAGPEFAPEAVAKMTDLEGGAEAVIGLAREFAGARRPLAVCGRGSGRVPGRIQEFLAVHCLNALAGAINRPGGVVAVPEPDYIDWPEPEMDAVASKGMQQPRVDGAGSAAYPLARYLLNRLPEALAAGQTPPVELLFVSNANPAHSLHDAAAAAKALDRIPTIVSFATHLDETAALADYILPNHAHLERLEEVPAAAGFPRPILGLAKPVIRPLGDTRHTGDAVLALARAVGGNVAKAFPWKTYPECLQETLGELWDGLSRKGYLLDAQAEPPRFETASGKFEFSNPEIARIPPFAAPQAAAGEDPGFPLTLIACDTLRLGAGTAAAAPYMVKALEETVLTKNDVRVEINPETARKLGLAENDAALLATPKGSFRVRLYLFDGIRPGVVALPRGLGHSAYDRFLAGKGVNVNALFAAAEDNGSGFEAAWGIRARLSKA